jgi:chemotaxis protein histidine kinase CheA
VRSDALKTGHAGTDQESDVFVRVEASRLERLMDLLAELVMLRNHRETHVESLRTIHKELNLCAARSRTLRTMIDFPEPGSSGKDNAVRTEYRSQAASGRFLSQSMNELAGDTAELGRSLHDIFEPLSKNNAAISHLIGCFRQELMELRRLPVGGLFQRLQRAIHEAARAEGKQVEIRLEGQGARAERGLQQRLFEPLLHLVRNAVSHGIQSAGERVRSGKPAVGRITLSAWSDAASLTLEVRDDGQGLNEAAIESRGRELGLLPPGESVTLSQIRQLIFHSGFSTRSSVSEISGRGVGMDVVDHWVRRLRGRIEVESTPGIGTAFRLRIPLRSAVEHAMIVRAGGQLFALPMHTVGGTSDAKLPISGFRRTPDTPAVPLNRLLQLPATQHVRSCLVTLRGTERQTESSRTAPRDGLTIAVDEIAGVEEVVVRPLPPLLQRNELFAGVTLSGRAETVLVLDTGRLLELGSEAESQHRVGLRSNSTRKDHDHSVEAELSHDRPPESMDGPCVLIVDDSVVVRRGLAKRLNAVGYRTQEAGDGHAALKLLRSSQIAAVVSDIDMPGMDGVELLQEMRRQKQYHTIPVAVLSSRDKQSMPPEILLHQPDIVLTKPITDETIKALVATFTQAGVLNSGQALCLQKR